VEWSQGTVLDSTKTQHKIRLAGIDAPEKKQAFGQRSKESLSDLVFNREVQVETTKRDRYGREIGKVQVDGLDANLEQIKRGMAWHYKAYQREQSVLDRQSYAEAEEVARGARVGLWKDDQPVPPWDFRHSR
jgi:endonuclease YncB( thermonuclease family)